MLGYGPVVRFPDWIFSSREKKRSHMGITEDKIETILLNKNQDLVESLENEVLGLKQ